jgi:hypothetical protein
MSHYLPNRMKDLIPDEEEKLTAKTPKGVAKIRRIVEHAKRMGWIKDGESQGWARPPVRKGAWTWHANGEGQGAM